MDLSSFLEHQRLSDEKGSSLGSEPVAQLEDEDDVDHSLDHITSGSKPKGQSTAPRKGKLETLEWNEELESLAREKAAAEATWGSLEVLLWGEHKDLRPIDRFEGAFPSKVGKATKSSNT